MFGGMGYPEGNRMMDRQIDDGMGVICRRRNDDSISTEWQKINQTFVFAVGLIWQI